MQRLVTSSEASYILGISLQGVHYRIKTNKLKSIKKNGKIFVYIDNDMILNNNNTNDILIIKNEQILDLKKSIKWIRKQYKNEILRLENNQEKIIQVFQSEINLLQSAFNEMRYIYKIEHNDINNQKDFTLMDIKDFFIFMKNNNKSDSEIKTMILDRIKNNDKRFVFKKDTKEVIIYKSDFIDLL
jgi:hypothetical protein